MRKNITAALLICALGQPASANWQFVKQGTTSGQVDVGKAASPLRQPDEAQEQPAYRIAVEKRVRGALKTPDKVSLQWGAEPTLGWAAMKGKPRADGLLGCAVVIGKNTGGGMVEDRLYLVYVFSARTSEVKGQIFTLNQINKARARHMGTWFSHDPGCPVS